MALISCTECGKEFSDRAKECPNCGCPIEFIVADIKKSNVQKEAQENIIYEYNILNTKLAVDNKLDTYLRLMMHKKTSISKYIDVITTYYYSQKSIDSIMETLPEYIATLIDEELDAAISTLVGCKIYELDKDTFYKKYEKSIDVSRIITPLMDIYLEILDYQDQVQKYHNYVRQAHKNQWTGGGFGIEGAIKGHIKAELMNMGTAFLYSYSDIKNKNQDQVKVIKAKNDLYRSKKTRDIVIDACVNVKISIFDAMISELISHGILNEYEFDTEKANKVFKNLDFVDNGDINAIYNICNQAFGADPLYYMTIEYIIEYGFDKNGDAIKFAKEYGLYDIYLSRVQKSLEEQYREEIIELLTLGSLATNESLFEVIDICVKIKNSGLSVDEYLDNAINNRIQFDLNSDDFVKISEYLNDPQRKRTLGEKKIKKMLKIVEENVKETADREQLANIVLVACNKYEKSHSWSSTITFSSKKDIKSTEKYNNYETCAEIPKDAEVYAIRVSGEYKETPSYIIAITNLGLYMAYDDCFHAVNISWYDFSQGVFGKLTNGVLINGHRIKMYDNEVADILSEIRNDLRKHLELKPEDLLGVLDEQTKIIHARLAECAKEICFEKSKKFHFPIHSFGFKKDLHKMSDYVIAEEGLQLPENINIYYLYAKFDENYLDKGIAISDLGVFWINGWFGSNERYYLNWLQFGKEKIAVKNNNILMIGEHEVHTLEAANYVFDILNNIQLKQKECNMLVKNDEFDFREKEIMDSSSKVDITENYDKIEQIEQKNHEVLDNEEDKGTINSVEDICNSFVKCHDKMEFFSPEKMLKYFNINSNENIYLAHDDTLFQTGKNGFIITNKGIYVRELVDKNMYFVSYEDFAKTKEITIKNSTYYIGDGIIAYYSGRNKQDVLELLEKIQKCVKR